MPRPRRHRRVKYCPDICYFKPAGIPKRLLEEVNLKVEEFEALRLKDYRELDQKECAKKMNVSQSTFHRLLSVARKKITESIVEGKAVRIEGGIYQIKK